MSKWLLVAAAAVLSGFTGEYPYRRPMQEAYKPALQGLQVYASVPEKGIGVAYATPHSSPNAGFVVGLIEAEQSEDALEDAAKLAAMLAKGVDPGGTERQWQLALVSALREAELSPQAEVKRLPSGQQHGAVKFAEPAVMLVNLSYVMSPDLTQLNLIADVQIVSKTLQYAGLYPGEAESWAKAEEEYQLLLRKAKRNGALKKPKPPPDQMRARLYRNNFRFISVALPGTEQSEARLNQQLEAIRVRAQEASRGQLTVSRENRSKLHRALKAAQDQALEQRARAWTANDGAELKRALSEGMQTLAQLLTRDLRGTQVTPLVARSADRVEVESDGSRRLMLTIGGYLTGQYTSEPVSVRPQAWGAIAFADGTAR